MIKALAILKETCRFSDDIHERRSSPLRLLCGFLFALLVFVFIFLSYTLIKPLNQAFETPNGMIAKAYGAILFTVLAISYVILLIRKKTNFEINIFYIMMLSLIIKLTYMLYTNGYTRQYDTWSTNNNGHYDYTAYLFQAFKLPSQTFTEANIYQFYHPPLHYFISAVWMRLFLNIGFAPSLISDTETLFCSVQILSTFYTFLISYYAIKTLRLVCKNKLSLYVGVIFVCFFPRLFQFSGQLNNDVLATLFVICSVFRLFKYIFEEKSYKNICLSALYLGLAMNTKLSAVIVCLGYAAYFIYLLVRVIMKKEDVKLSTIIIQYVLFICITGPIGLWFQFYAHEVYGMPFNFVFRNLNAELFTGTRSYVLSHSYLSVEYYDAHNGGLIYSNPFINFLVRFISPIYFKDFASRGIFAEPFSNYNILTYAIKTTIFGEFPYWGGEGFGIIACMSGYILWFAVIVITIVNICKKRFDLSMLVSLGITISIIAFYLYLQVSMPYGCSMDARYIVPILLPLGILIMKNIEFMPLDNKVSSVIRWMLIIVAVTFAASSGLFYCFAI